jgi:putative inorganic carbon (HCO3(-)) transporter
MSTPGASGSVDELLSLAPRRLVAAFRRENWGFWMISMYLFVEYVRPQSIITGLDFLPWAQVFIGLSLVAALQNLSNRTRDATNAWMVLFMLTILLSSASGYWPDYSYTELENSYKWVIIYFLIINLVRTETQLFIFILIFLIASFKISASLAIRWAGRGFAFTDWGLKGPPGFFENSGELAIQMVVFWPIAMVYARNLAPSTKSFVRGMMYLMPITAGMTVLGASSRGGQLALAIQLAARYWRNLFKLRVLATVAVIGVSFVALLPDEQKARFEEIGDDRTSQQRLLYWQRGYEMFTEHPLLGVGYFNFAPYFNRHYPQDALYGKAQLPHNIFVQVASELGALGLSCYLALIYSAFSATRASKRALTLPTGRDRFFKDLADALNVSFIGFLVAGQFVSVVYYPFMWIHLALVVCLRNITAKLALGTNSTESHRT